MDNLNWHKIKSGDKRAFRMLFDECYSSLCLYANSVIGDLDIHHGLKWNLKDGEIGPDGKNNITTSEIYNRFNVEATETDDEFITIPDS